MKFLAKNLEETQKIAGDFIADLKPLLEKATIVGLYGNLGAGKTSFTQGVAKALGIKENIVSPTFVIMKKYEIVARGDSETQNLDTSYLLLTTGFQHLIHIDAYRLEQSNELLTLGWQETISNPKNLVLIEWPEQVSDIIPEHIRINFSHTNEEEREIEII